MLTFDYSILGESHAAEPINDFRQYISGLVSKWRTLDRATGLITEQTSLSMTVKPDASAKGLNRVSVLTILPNIVADGSVKGTLQGRVDFIIPSSATNLSRQQLTEFMVIMLKDARFSSAICQVMPPEAS